MVENRESFVLRGIAASPGIQNGPAFVVLQERLEIPIYRISEDQKAVQLERFEMAREQTREQIRQLSQRVGEQLGPSEAQIFQAHLMVLEDPSLLEETRRQVDALYNIEYAFHTATERSIAAFRKLEDPYLRERTKDVQDVTRRLLWILMGKAEKQLLEVSSEHIIVSEDLSPSEAIELEHAHVLGMATDSGSRTSHAVIMARALNVPAVIGLKEATKRIENGDFLILDGYQGIIIVNPDATTRAHYEQLQTKHDVLDQKLKNRALKDAKTKDGYRVHTKANLSSPEECQAAINYGAEGVGLYRTETLFMLGDQDPQQEEQYQAYLTIAQQFHPHPVIIRTFDLGGDKTSIGGAREKNPALGLRGIRYCLQHPQIFIDQLKAILKASAEGNVQLMYPMISSLGELQQANALLEQAKAELSSENINFDAQIKVGIMIETPAAALICDMLAEHCDFFSIGTNDLTQYLLAADRTNAHAAVSYNPAHPALLRLLEYIFKAARKREIPVHVCGEMAADLLYIPLLLGLGADHLSTAPPLLPQLKNFIRSCRLTETQALLKSVLQETSQEAVQQRLEEFLSIHA